MTNRGVKRLKKLFEGYQPQVERARELEDKIEEVFHQLKNFKAITYGGIPGTTNPQEKEYKRLELIEKKAELEKELAFVNEYIDRVNTILNMMPYQNKIFFIMKYKNQKSYEAIAHELHYSSGSAVYKKMDAILKRM